ncbi:hypothetical protein V8B97DRAFT_1994524 [Scleroderma yunnanense]
MADDLRDEFYSPIYSGLSDQDNLAVSVGKGSQLVVIRVEHGAKPPLFHFKKVRGDFPSEYSYYEISIHNLNTLVEGREVVAIPGARAHTWILEYQSRQHEFVILQHLFWPSSLWNVNANKTISIGLWEEAPYPKRQLFRIPLLQG